MSTLFFYKKLFFLNTKSIIISEVIMEQLRVIETLSKTLKVLTENESKTIIELASQYAINQIIRQIAR